MDQNKASTSSSDANNETEIPILISDSDDNEPSTSQYASRKSFGKSVRRKKKFVRGDLTRLLVDDNSKRKNVPKSFLMSNNWNKGYILKSMPLIGDTDISFATMPDIDDESLPVLKSPGHVEKIGGVEVHFPVKPYGCQLALMFKVITGLTKKQNCLLESPTGSGKTLALLCSSLAWQRHERDRIEKCTTQMYYEEHPELMTDSSVDSPKKASPIKTFNRTAFGDQTIYDSPKKESVHHEPVNKESPAEDENLIRLNKRRKIISDSSADSSEVSLPVTPEKIQSSPQQQQTPPHVSVPVIFYGARTHKQIQQVVKEFRRTYYCGNAKMSILSSRDYSCIRPFDRSAYTSKNDMCKECVPKKTDAPRKPGEESKCVYYDNKRLLSHKALPPAFDLEDLISTGEELKACPYYAARSMAKEASIVFCPYNYLLDPGIRSSMQIDVNDAIIILDEAHNIEDVCREAASFKICLNDITKAIKEINAVASLKYYNQDIMQEMFTLLRALMEWEKWFINQKPLLALNPVNNNEITHTWDIEDLVQTLNNHNIGLSHYGEFSNSANLFTKKLREDASRLYGISQSTGILVESISTVLGYLFRDNCKYMDDYKPALIKVVSACTEPVTDSAGFKSTLMEKTEKEELTLRLMCMNPAVVFSALKPARSIILTSGTLTPLVSLHSELGATFPLQVSPNHIIPRDRVWVGTLNTGPDGQALDCTMRGSDRVSVQDSLGNIVICVSQMTPNGVLCFLPSYQLMNKLIGRWRETGIWNEMNKIKHVFTESRNMQDHSEIMERFYNRVGTSKGALLFAVYRGKVSEGMDFKDHQARAVITIGIPYPNAYDMMIREKMSYNDRHSQDRQLLSSSEWLRVQAYRALNQAVGRCVRHREDWGAVLMCDSRFITPYYTEHLSKWVRNFLGNNHHTFNSLIMSDHGLKNFMQHMKMEE